MHFHRRFLTGYLNISYHLVIFSFIAFLVQFAFFPSPKVFAADGSISGRIRSYSTSANLSGIVVTAAVYDSSYGVWKPQKSVLSGSDGSYKLDELPPGQYRICATGTEYVTECYEKNCTAGRDCGISYFHNPGDNLVTVLSGQNTLNINFYLQQGGKIGGKVYNHEEDAPVRVVVEGEILYKNEPPVIIEDDPYENNPEIFAHLDPNSRYIIIQIPRGKYSVKVRDNSIMNTLYYEMEHRYYYEHFYNNKVIKDDADYIFINPNHTSNYIYNNIDFHLVKGGIICGKLIDSVEGYYINGAPADAISQNIGFSKTFISETAIEINPIDPNNFSQDGFFYLSGLPPGQYILRIRPVFALCGEVCEIYLDEFYDNVRSEANATIINVSAGQKVSLDIYMERYPKISGWVIKADPGSCNTYDPNKAIQGMEVKITGIHPDLPKPVKTDNKGRYLIAAKNFSRIGDNYYVEVSDPNDLFIYQRIGPFNLEINKEYVVNFCLEKATHVTTQSVSGYVYLDEDPLIPLSNIEIIALNALLLSIQGKTLTDENGRYYINIAKADDYILFTSKVQNPDHTDLTLELYKDVTILDDSLFIEGNIIINEIADLATWVHVSRGEDVENINFGLSSYRYTFKKGFNVFGYPGEPVDKYDTSYEICSYIGPNLYDFRWKDPVAQKWKVTKPHPSNPFVMTGDNFPIKTGEAYLIYMKAQSESLYLPPFKTLQPGFYTFNTGKNYIAYPSTINDTIKNSYDLLSAIGNEISVTGLHNYDNRYGKWLSNAWVYRKHSGRLFPINQGEGYVVHMTNSSIFSP